VTFLICTSLPPLTRQQRFNSKGRNVSEEYAQLCIQSWIDASDEVVSVNSLIESNCGLEERIDSVVYQERDGSKEVGRPLLCIRDILSVATQRSDVTHVGIVNADIYLKGNQVSYDLDRLSGDTFVCEARFDTRDVGELGGKRFRHGYDFFILSRSQQESLKVDSFFIGVPWWDHYVPIALIFSGFRPSRSSQLVPHSLIHEERWDIDLWTEFGQRFVRSVSFASCRSTVLSLKFCRYASWVLLAKYWFWLRQWAVSVPREQAMTHRLLNRLSRENIRFIEHSRMQK
jgi:hypothetical protein